MSGVTPTAGRHGKAAAGAARPKGHAHGKPKPHGKPKHRCKPKRHHKCPRKHHKKKAPPHVSGLPGAPAPPAIPVSPPPPSSSPPPSVGAPITLAQARRLLWRAGFGPAPGQAEALAGQPLEAVVQSLTRPSGAAVLHGPGADRRRRQRARTRRTPGARTTAGGWTAWSAPTSRSSSG